MQSLPSTRCRRWRNPVGLMLLFFFLVAAPAAAGAEDQDHIPMLTLEESIAIALERNLQVRIAEDSLAAAELQRQQARTGFLPKLKLEYGYLHPSETTINFGGTSIQTTDDDQWSLTGIVEQPLFTGFATSTNYQLAILGVDLAAIQKELVRLDLVLQVKEAYYGILSAEKILAVAEQAVLQLQSQLEVARNFYQVGMSPKIDVLEAEVRLAAAEQQLTRAVNELAVAKAKFNTILRQPPEAPVRVVDALSSEPFEESYESVLAIAMRRRPEIRQATRQVEQAEQKIRLAASDFYPDVVMSFNYLRQGDDPLVNGSPYSDREKWNVQAAATWTLFEWGKTRDAVSRSRVRWRQAQRSLEQLKDYIALEVKTAYLGMKTAEKNIWVAQKAVESAEENFRISKERYREQVATATEVLDAQTRLTQARTNYTNALVDYNLARARLLRAMGLETD